MKSITMAGAITSIAAGLFGMLFCMPYLISSNLEDLIGAGLPFVAGAIMLVGGLMTMGMSEKRKVKSEERKVSCEM